MRVLHGSAGFPRGQRSAVALGNFDGIHLGHQAIVALAKSVGAKHNHPSVVFTLDPHPAVVLRHGTPPPRITSVEEKIEILDGLGVDYLVVEPFTIDFAALTPEEFVRTILRDRLQAAHAFVGDNFGFGKGRAGKAADLQRLGNAAGFETTIVEPVLLDGAPVSSTRIRAAVQQGDVSLASRLLGRPFQLRGTIVHGAARGTGLGFPTANVAPEKDLIPGRGVYATRAIVDRVRVEPSVTNVGIKPTFGGEALTIEAFLLDYEGPDIYGHALELQFLAKLRDEQKFPGIDALKQQIAKDVAKAREILRP